MRFATASVATHMSAVPSKSLFNNELLIPEAGFAVDFQQPYPAEYSYYASTPVKISNFISVLQYTTITGSVNFVNGKISAGDDSDGTLSYMFDSAALKTIVIRYYQISDFSFYNMQVWMHVTLGSGVTTYAGAELTNGWNKLGDVQIPMSKWYSPQRQVVFTTHRTEALLSLSKLQGDATIDFISYAVDEDGAPGTPSVSISWSCPASPTLRGHAAGCPEGDAVSMSSCTLQCATGY